MAERLTLFVDVILPLALPQTYTYRVPYEWNEALVIGQRVIVQFGKGRKQYSAIVSNIHENPPKSYEAKYLEAILDDRPIIHPVQLEFWQWISEYYISNIGEVMTAALPGGLRLASETRILLHPEYKNTIELLKDDEYLIVEALEVRNVLNLKEIAEILDIKFVQPKVKALIENRLVMVEEEIKYRYKAKLVDYLRLSKSAQKEDRLQQIFDELEKAPRQLEALMSFIQLSQHFSSNPKEVKRLSLQKAINASSSLINELIRKDILELYQKEASRLNVKDISASIQQLTQPQQKAYEGILQHFKANKVALLHGITSSGKTEVYFHLIRDALKENKQVLYLLPEIALTSQMVQRLQAIFGEKVGVYHSRFNENERVELWNQVFNFKPNEEQRFQIILGARSALFLPFSHLGLIIVDEEHENTFKQYDPAPRYQARDAALVLANMQKANVVLGSATPSVESYYNAEEGKYGMVELNKRYGDIQVPEIQVVDMKEAQRKKRVKSHFSEELLEAMEQCLAEKKQVILFRNRRGYAPFMICETCGNSPQCKNCDVSLTYHKFKKELNCHYCGYHIALPKTCPSCGDTNMRIKGFGTEKIEEELSIYLEKAKVKRMDLDTTRAKKAYHQIITAFEDREIDILVGTQMVAKGLDFENVGLVGILNADNMLHFPDFRAFERSFQLMTQVAGRAGRKGERGKVLIQAYHSDHQVIQQVINNDYRSMYTNELIERKNFQYPPFHRLIKITLRHRDRKSVHDAAQHMASSLKHVFGTRILGPEEPHIARIRNYYLQNILIKLEKKASLKKSKALLQEKLKDFSANDQYKSIRLGIDVDPF